MSQESNPDVDNLVYKQLSIFGNSSKVIPLEQLCYYLLDAFNVYREVNGFKKLTMQEFIDSQPTVKHDGSGPLVPESFEKETTQALEKLVRLGLIRQTSTGDYEINTASIFRINTDNSSEENRVIKDIKKKEKQVEQSQINLSELKRWKTEYEPDGYPEPIIDMDKLEDDQC